MGQCHQVMMIAVLAPLLMLHKVGAGDIGIDENLRIMSVNVMNYYAEYSC